MKKIRRFGVSLEEDLFRELDGLVKRHKFPSRSQAIRFLIRQNITEEAWENNKQVSGALVLIFDHHKRQLIDRSMDIHHDFADSILATQHVHLDHHNCLEIIALKGSAVRLKRLSETLIALKGVKHGKLVMTKT
jgi:CopG family transcriptional regulator, nickel-responsive regulator